LYFFVEAIAKIGLFFNSANFLAFYLIKKGKKISTAQAVLLLKTESQQLKEQAFKK